eukprot:jgi/Chlat1/6108/Chrsp40S05679
MAMRTSSAGAGASFWLLCVLALLSVAVVAAEPSAQHAASVSSAEYTAALAKAAAAEARNKILELELAAAKKAVQASEDLLAKARESHKSELEKVLADLLAAKAAASDASHGAGQVAELQNQLKTVLDEFAQYRERQSRVLKQVESKADELLQRASSAETKLQDLSNADSSSKARAEKAESHLTDLQEAINKAKKDLAARTEDLVALQHAWMPHWLQARYAAIKVLADDVHAKVKPTVDQATGASKAYMSKVLDATKDVRTKAMDAVKLTWEKVKPVWAEVVAAWERFVASAAPYITQVKAQWHRLVQLASPHARALSGHANRYWSTASVKVSELHARFAETQIGQRVDEGIARLQSAIKHALMQHELTARFATDKALRSLVSLVLAVPLFLALYFVATLLTLPFSRRRRPQPPARKSVKAPAVVVVKPASSSSSSRVLGSSQAPVTGDIAERKPRMSMRRE